MELLPGIGKRHRREIVKEREKKQFKSFEDIKERVKLIPSPAAVIIKRIVMELKDEDNHKLFVGL